MPFQVLASEVGPPFLVVTPEGEIEVQSQADADAIAKLPEAHTFDEFMAAAGVLKSNFDTAAQRLYRVAIQKAGEAKGGS